MHLTIPGRPVPKKRPRVTKTHTYTPKETTQQETKILAAYQQKYGRKKLEGEIELICGFYYSDKRVADTTNLIKLVEDGLGGGRGRKDEGWHPFNDRQITKVHGYRVTGREEEKTIIYLREV